MRLRFPVLPLALVLAGCGDDEPTAEERRAEVVNRLAVDLRVETDGALDEERSICVAAELVDAVGVDRFDQIVASAEGEGDLDGALRDQVVDVFAACDALDPLVEG